MKCSSLLLPLSLSLSLFACSGSETSNIALSASSGAEVAQSGTVTVLLWGYDTSLADASASLIEVYTEDVDGVPVTISFEHPDDANELIDQGAGPVSARDASFYFSVYLDVDGDGQICPGDWIQDYEVTDFASFDAPPASISVALKPAGSDYSCHPIVDTE